MTHCLRCLLPVAALVATTTSTSAQCANAWASFGAVAGVSYPVNAVASWDPDGPGPLPPRVAVGGSFSTAGNVAAIGVAAWDPATGSWSALGAGISGYQTGVNVLLPLPNGDLIAGGSCYATSAPQALLRWNGTTWAPFGGLTAAEPGVAALALLPNGDLAVGGYFTSAGAVALPYVGVWNGTSWSSLGGGMDGPVLELQLMPNGDLVALGQFTVAGGVPASGIARWNGAAWSAVGGGISGSVWGYGPQAEAAAVLPNGDLVVGGTFTHAGGVPASNLARWDGTSWSAFGGGVGGSSYYTAVRGLVVLPNGDVVAGGLFVNAGGIAIPNIARWDGSVWSSFGGGIPAWIVGSFAVLPNGDLIAGGAFSVAGGVGANHVARWDGTAWSPLGGGTAPSDLVRALTTLPDGSILAGGAFRAAGTVVTNGVARWDGAAWSPLGGGVPLGARVNALAVQPNGHVVAGGFGFVSRWDGFAWTALGGGFWGGPPHQDSVKAVAVLPNGDVVAGGDFSQVGSSWINGLARWDGTSWSPLGNGGGFEIDALAVLDNGDLIVGGDVLWGGSASFNGITRWNGTSWSSFGSGVQIGNTSGRVFAIARLPGNTLIAGGSFTSAGGLPANNIARWDGAAWWPLGTGVNGNVRTLHVLPNGDVIAAGEFTQAGGVAASQIARWNGSSWSAIGSGVQATSPGVCALAMTSAGELLVGGLIATAGGQSSPNLARLTTTCPASVQSQGAGCAGDTVTASMPWTGGTWRADASGLPSTAAVFVVNGAGATSLPLAAVFATAQPGCTLHVQPDVVDLVVASAGTASFQFALPNTPSLAGVTFRHQMVSLALDSTLAVTATNALQLTVGAF